MKQEEFYFKALEITEEATDVDRESMMKSNKEECVDARHILVAALSENGMSDGVIAKYMGLTRSCVCGIRNSFEDRKSRRFVRMCFDEVSRHIRKIATN